MTVTPLQPPPIGPALEALCALFVTRAALAGLQASAEVLTTDEATTFAVIYLVPGDDPGLMLSRHAAGWVLVDLLRDLPIGFAEGPTPFATVTPAWVAAAFCHNLPEYTPVHRLEDSIYG